MKPLVVASNMYNEIEQLEEWFDFVKEIADGGILIVDSGSTDGTTEFFAKKVEEGHQLVVVLDEIIQREGYGPARNHLRFESKRHFPKAHWMIYLDADERIDEADFHKLRWIKDYLIDEYDIVALPRIDWLDKEKKKMAKDFRVNPDWQARMSRLDTPIEYVRRLHEQVTKFNKIYTKLNGPKINHFHRSTEQKKRDFIGKLCAKLHEQDEYGHTYPEHHKEAYYRDMLKKEGLK